MQDIQCFWALDGQLGSAVGEVFEFSAALIVRTTPIPVLFDVGGIHHQQVFVLVYAIHQEVIHYAALLIGEIIVLSLAVGQYRHVVGTNLLKEVQCPGAADGKFTHMGNIEHAHSLANTEMFGQDTGIFDGHVVTGKFMHFGFEPQVDVCKRSCFHAEKKISCN